MKTKITVDLGDLQKTLFMPVWERAVESKKKESVRFDHTALNIIGPVYLLLSDSLYTLK